MYSANAVSTATVAWSLKMPPPPYCGLLIRISSDVVRRRRRDVAHRAVVERERVALAVEDVVRRRRAACAGSRRCAACSRRSRDVGRSIARTLKSRLPALERLDGEQPVDQPLRVGVELRQLGLGVAVAEEQQVDLRRRRARSRTASRPCRPASAGGRHEPRRRVDDGRPDLVERVQRGRASSRTTCTGAFGHGKRSDSWKVRCTPCFASAVVSHSP